MVLNSPIGPLAKLEMGRALALEGKLDQAKAAYDDFFKRWANADPAIPVLKEAMKEYARRWGPPPMTIRESNASAHP